MAKFVVECPNCHRYLEAKSGWGGTKELKCACGERIVLRGKDAQQATRICPNCHNEVVYDLRKGAKATCPICRAKIATTESLNSSISFACTRCGCTLHAQKGWTKPVICPACGEENDVQRQVQMAEQKASGEPVVLQYEGGNDILVWRHPLTDFVTGSTLIVHKSQEAIFFKDGNMLDSLPAGRHTLTTDTLPLLSKHEKLATSGMNPFHSEVYFVNLVPQKGLKWGGAVTFNDVGTDIPVTIRARGRYNVTIGDSRKFIRKNVGTEESFSRAQLEDVNGAFHIAAREAINSFFTQAFRELGINILETDASKNRIAEYLTQRMSNSLFDDYGLNITEVVFEDITLPSREDNPQFWELKDQIARAQIVKGEAEIKLTEARGQQAVDVVGLETQLIEERYKTAAEKERQSELGYTYQQKQGFEALKTLAGNEGASGTINNAAMGTGMGIGFGLPMGAAAGGVFSKAFEAAFESPNQPNSGLGFGGRMADIGASEGGAMPFSGFGNSGSRMTPQQEHDEQSATFGNAHESPQQAPRDLKSSFEELESIRQYLSEEEYQTKRKEILDSIK